MDTSGIESRENAIDDGYPRDFKHRQTRRSSMGRSCIHEAPPSWTVGVRHGCLEADGMILTHLETALHHLWPALQEIAWPVNYLTHGTRVPEDLTVADAKSMERWLHRSWRRGG